MRGTGFQPIAPDFVTESAYSAKCRVRNRAYIVSSRRTDQQMLSLGARSGSGARHRRKFAYDASRREVAKPPVRLCKPQVAIASGSNHPRHDIVLQVICCLASVRRQSADCVSRGNRDPNITVRSGSDADRRPLCHKRILRDTTHYGQATDFFSAEFREPYIAVSGFDNTVWTSTAPG